MIRKTGIMLGLVAVLALSACNDASPAIDLTAEEIVAAMTDAMATVKTYQYEADFDVSMTTEVAGESMDASVTMTMSGSLDIERLQMQADVIMETSIPGEDMDIGEIGMQMYLVDDAMYVHTQMPEMGEPSMWLKSEVPEGYWEEMNQVESQMQLLEAGQVILVGSQKVGSVDCYVLEIIPDMAQLWETMMAQGQAAGGAFPVAPGETDLPDISNFSVKQWVAKDTYYLMKAEIVMTIAAPDEAAGLFDFSMEMTTVMTTHDYNRPVSIELPAAAEDAIDMGAFDESFGASETETREDELANIQAAVTTMMVVNELAVLPNPVTVPTDDMTVFPDTSTIDSGDKAVDVYGDAFASGDEDGYVLYMHDETADDDWFSTVDYVATWFTTYWYTVDENGTVTQHLSPEW